jgi:hypothetical protein
VPRRSLTVSRDLFHQIVQKVAYENHPPARSPINFVLLHKRRQNTIVAPRNQSRCFSPDPGLGREIGYGEDSILPKPTSQKKVEHFVTNQNCCVRSLLTDLSADQGESFEDTPGSVTRGSLMPTEPSGFVHKSPDPRIPHLSTPCAPNADFGMPVNVLDSIHDRCYPASLEKRFLVTLSPFLVFRLFRLVFCVHYHELIIGESQLWDVH